MATFTRLDDRGVRAIARRFGLGDVTQWAAIPAGTINSNFSLHTATDRYFARINEGKSAADVRYEAELLTALVAAGVPAPLPLRSDTGQPFAVFDGRFVSLFPWIRGTHREPDEVSRQDAAALGEALARLHLAGLGLAEKFARPSRYSYKNIVHRAEGLLASPQSSRDPELAAALVAIQDEIAWLDASEDVRRAATSGIIHGDLFRDNVMFDGPRLTALIDFEQASTGSLVYDLAVCLNAWCFRDRGFDPELIAALVAGYRRVRQLSPEDLQALPVEVRAAAMRFTVTRITDVYLAGVENPAKDFRRYLARLERWRAIGAGVLARWADLAPAATIPRPS